MLNRQTAIVFICLTTPWIAVSAFAGAKAWSLDSYHANLPDKFRTFSPDHASLPTGGNSVQDDAAGYVAYFESKTQKAEPPYPYFEMAVFKPLQGDDLVVISNLRGWSVDSEHETFFLRRHGDDWQETEWIDVREQVLPALRLEMFFSDAEVVAEIETAFAESEKKPPPPDLLHKYLHFSPSRSGNRILVSLDLEQYAPQLRSDTGIDQEFIEKQKSLWLEWDKQDGVFKLAAPPVFSAQEKEWTIVDYLKHLPARYRRTYGDFQTTPTAETTIQDVRNGYIAYLNEAPHPGAGFQPYPIFEMALFRQANRDALLVVSSTRSDSVQTEHDTFFLRKRGEDWISVREEVLPRLALEMFFADPKLAQKLDATLQSDSNRSAPHPLYRYLHFSPERTGTRLKVSLDDEAYIGADPGRDDNPDVSFAGTPKSISLQWDKQKGAFTVNNNK